MQTVDKYMTSSPHTIGAGQTLRRALHIMRDNGIRHLPVLQGGTLVGILSERDIHFVESLAGTDLDKVDVTEAMTPEPYTVRALALVDEVAGHMARHRIGSAVVVDEGDNVVGIFTAVDALTALSWIVERSRPQRL